MPPNGGACPPPPHFQRPRIFVTVASHTAVVPSLRRLAVSSCRFCLLHKTSQTTFHSCQRRVHTPTNTHYCWLQEDGHLYPHRDRSHPPTAFVSRNAHLASAAGWLVHTQKRVVRFLDNPRTSSPFCSRCSSWVGGGRRQGDVTAARRAARLDFGSNKKTEHYFVRSRRGSFFRTANAPKSARTHTRPEHQHTSTQTHPPCSTRDA